MVKKTSTERQTQGGGARKNSSNKGRI